MTATGISKACHFGPSRSPLRRFKLILNRLTTEISNALKARPSATPNHCQGASPTTLTLAQAGMAISHLGGTKRPRAAGELR